MSESTDGLDTSLFFHLSKRNRLHKSCDTVLIPDTVIFENNYPNSWYSRDEDTGEIIRRTGRFLDYASLSKGFVDRYSPKDSICAHFATIDQGISILTNNQVLNILQKSAERTRPDGMLQKFIRPHGDKNHAFFVVWSPSVAIIQKKLNRRRLTDRTCSKLDKVVTFEGSDHLVTDVVVCNSTRHRVLALCDAIVQHCAFLDNDPITITRMALLLKENDAGDMVFMWCTSLRIASPQTPRKPLHMGSPGGGRRCLRSELSDTLGVQEEIAAIPVRADPELTVPATHDNQLTILQSAGSKKSSRAVAWMRDTMYVVLSARRLKQLARPFVVPNHVLQNFDISQIDELLTNVLHLKQAGTMYVDDCGNMHKPCAAIVAEFEDKLKEMM